MQEKKNYVIYTDGACKGNPGHGGWGVYIKLKDESVKELFGYEKLTTNNKMELTAAIKSLEYFKYQENITLFTDSNYLKQGITIWINSWKKNNWKNNQNKTIKNLELWQRLDYLNQFHNVEWNWVKAHDGNFGNEKADQLANKAIELNLNQLLS